MVSSSANKIIQIIKYKYNKIEKNKKMCSNK